MDMNTLTAFRRDILIVLAGLDEPHGLAIREALTEVYPSDVHHGRLYPNLDALVEEGLIDKDTKDKRTNEYSLTEDGREAIREYREWMDEHTVNINRV
jgi:DNA-binding PadR family transcriptional regulator